MQISNTYINYICFEPPNFSIIISIILSNLFPNESILESFFFIIVIIISIVFPSSPSRLLPFNSALALSLPVNSFFTRRWQRRKRPLTVWSIFGGEHFLLCCSAHNLTLWCLHSFYSLPNFLHSTCHCDCVFILLTLQVGNHYFHLLFSHFLLK